MSAPVSRCPAAARFSIDVDALVAFTRELVRIPSVNRPEEGLDESRAAARVAEQMRSFGWEPRVEEVAADRPNVVAVLEGDRAGRTLMFEGHTDVVTEGERAAWSHAPFGGDIVDGRLYGRGAADMKAGVACMLFAADAVARAGFPGRLVVAALVDEEEMMIGAKAFAADPLASRIDAAIVCEPEGGEVCHTQKGAVRLRVDAVGRMAHGAMPDHGLNPVYALCTFGVRMAEVERDLQVEHGADEHLGPPFLTPTVLLAGEPEQVNVIPGDAWMALDIRTIPGVDHGELLRRLEAEAAIVGRDTDVDIKLTVIDDRPPTRTPPDSDVVVAVMDAHEVVVGERPPLGGVPGTTDGTILWRDARIPVVTYGPGGKWIAHQVDEYVEIEELGRYALVYAEAASRYLESER
ncbi:MAG: M20 family metallopeptidase [Actinomycetota bacterium]